MSAETFSLSPLASVRKWHPTPRCWSCGTAHMHVMSPASFFFFSFYFVSWRIYSESLHIPYWMIN